MTQRTMRPEVARAVVLEKVYEERQRQEQLLKEGKFTFTAASEVNNALKASILGEEVGEVHKALNDGDDLASLQAELVQVAAVAVAWAESLEREMEAAQ